MQSRCQAGRGDDSIGACPCTTNTCGDTAADLAAAAISAALPCVNGTLPFGNTPWTRPNADSPPGEKFDLLIPAHDKELSWGSTLPKHMPSPRSMRTSCASGRRGTVPFGRYRGASAKMKLRFTPHNLKLPVPPMRVRCLSTLKKLAPYAEDWERLAAGVPFRSWTWLQHWWRQYGPEHSPAANSRLAVVCIFDARTHRHCSLVF